MMSDGNRIAENQMSSVNALFTNFIEAQNLFTKDTPVELVKQFEVYY